jgi:hypothetical protein
MNCSTVVTVEKFTEEFSWGCLEYVRLTDRAGGSIVVLETDFRDFPALVEKTLAFWDQEEEVLHVIS